MAAEAAQGPTGRKRLSKKEQKRQKQQKQKQKHAEKNDEQADRACQSSAPPDAAQEKQGRAKKRKVKAVQQAPAPSGAAVADADAEIVPASGSGKKRRRRERLQQKKQEERKAKKEQRLQDPKSQVQHQQEQEPPRKQMKKETPPIAARVGGLTPEVSRIIESLLDRSVPGTLSDRLNPTDQSFDKALKDRWKTFSKKERAAIVAADQQRGKAAEEAVSEIAHPFQADQDDHCETAPEAYRDVAPLLRNVAAKLGKTAATLKIYDPYFCAGAVVGHLKELGFENVYNKCEDFYTVIKEGRVPEHDVVVTNPPYSGDHVEKLLDFCVSNAKPFFLLMPSYFCLKPYYEPAVGGASKVLYLYPKKRYVYWTPKGLRSKDKVQAHARDGGNRTSPFISFWYVCGAPAQGSKAMLEWWSTSGEASAGATMCRHRELPAWLLR